MIYIILRHPGHNRVYYQSAEKLALAELEIASRHFQSGCSDLNARSIKGVSYLSFNSSSELTGADLQLVSGLSFVFALFRLEEKGKDFLLHPIQLPETGYMDDKISSLLKYPGKTNELFTRMMISVGLLSSAHSNAEKISLLDPVAGRGTTLFEGLLKGYDVFGIEKDAKAVHESMVFFRKYLEKERFKHRSATRQVSGKGKKDARHIHEFSFARNKQEFSVEEEIRHLGMVNGDATEAGMYFAKEQFHLIVGDLPYGIAHGSRTGKKHSGGTRNPSELLEACLPGWYSLMKKGACLIMAWNSFLVPRDKLASLFEHAGFEVLNQAPYDNFEHMVDRSIKRDLILAIK